MKKFPETIGWHNWGELMCDVELFHPLVEMIFNAHGLPCGAIEAGYPGTHAVFRAGDIFVKLYAPLGINDEFVERAVYRAAKNAGFNGLPKLLGEGVLPWEGREWKYILLSAAKGTAIRELWPEMDERARLSAAEALADWARAYRALPEPFEPGAPGSAQAFLASIESRLAKTRRILTEGGVPEADAFVRGVSERFKGAELTLLHADLTEDHLLIDDGRYAVIDPADSHMGYAPIDWTPVWFSALRRDREAFLGFLRRSGVDWNNETRLDMMAGCALHAFGGETILETLPDRSFPIEGLFPEA